MKPRTQIHGPFKFNIQGVPEFMGKKLGTNSRGKYPAYNMNFTNISAQPLNWYYKII